MMNNDGDSILDDLLSRWHNFCRGYKGAQGSSKDPMFSGSRSSRQWDSMDEVVESEVMGGTMAAMDFEIMGDRRGQGGMPEPHRTAILINARNCYTGHNVWLSPRLPADRDARTVIVIEARSMLMRRLLKAGIV